MSERSLEQLPAAESGLGVAFLVVATLVGILALPAQGRCQEAAAPAAGRTVRITAPREIEIPGLIKVESDGTVISRAPFVRERQNTLTLQLEHRTLCIPTPGTSVIGKVVTADESGITILRREAPREVLVPKAAVAMVEVLPERSTAGEALAPGDVELSTGLSLSSRRESTETVTVLNVPLRVGGMLSGGFELEGEMQLTFNRLAYGDQGNSETAVSGAAHCLYHFRRSGDAVPFLLLGAGYGNSASISDFGMTGDPWLLRAGLGVKFFVGRQAALRVEYRFTHSSASFEGECNAPGAVCPNHVTIDDHGILFGISLWLRRRAGPAVPGQ